MRESERATLRVRKMQMVALAIAIPLALVGLVKASIPLILIFLAGD